MAGQECHTWSWSMYRPSRVTRSYLKFSKMGKVIMPYFEKKQLSLKALAPRDLETFFRYERQQEEATVQQLLDWHKELSDAFQYAIDSNWLKVNPIKEVDP